MGNIASPFARAKVWERIAKCLRVRHRRCYLRDRVAEFSDNLSFQDAGSWHSILLSLECREQQQNATNGHKTCGKLLILEESPSNGRPSGRGGRRFKSCRSDQMFTMTWLSRRFLATPWQREFSDLRTATERRDNPKLRFALEAIEGHRREA